MSAKGWPAAEEALKYWNSVKEPLDEGPTEVYKDVEPLAYALSHFPIRSRRQIRIVVAGAGFSGLALAREVHVGGITNASITVYEKNGSVGGTCCACDIPVHNYQYSWAPNPHFPSYYAAGKHIHDYLEKVTDQHGIREYIKPSHKIIGAKWIEERQKWQVKVCRTDGRELMIGNSDTQEGESGEPFIDECDVFVNATGCFNNWKWPAVPNRESFKGKMIHSAAWPNDDSFLDGSTVGLIGNGSTGVQILPAVLDRVKKIYVFMRSPTWITAGFAQKFAGPDGSNVVFSDEQKAKWEKNPDEYLKYRKEVESELNCRFRLYLKYSKEQADAKKFSVDQMSGKLAAKDGLAEKLIPDFAVGCRRPTPGNGYLEALTSDKVELVWGSVESFTETGLVLGGKTYEVDNIICATGFNMGFAPRFPIVGRNGVDLKHKWETSPPEAYLSVTAADMPNYFIYMGPHSPLGHGSVISAIERITQYIRMLVEKMQEENYSSVVPKEHIPRSFQKQSLAWLSKTAWNDNCASTFKNGKTSGPLVSLHGGSRLHYFDLLSKPRFEDFEWQSLCPDPDMAFAWLANGFTVDEQGAQEHLTWFIGDAPKENFITQTPGPAVNGSQHAPPGPDSHSVVDASTGETKL